MTYRQKLLLAVSTALLTSVNGVPVAQAAESGDSTTDPLEEIVVTGAASAQGIRKQDAGYAITTLSDQAIHDVQPISASDLMNQVPGMWAETSGGVGGPNVDVRGFPADGDDPWVSLQLDGLPIYGVTTLGYLDNTNMFRLDDTLARLEATIGGPAVLWGLGQPGATVNFIEKNGRDNPGGSVRYTTGTGDLQRVDLYEGGKIADGWYASIGGFYRTDQGVRNTQFPADQGYQLVGTVLHEIEDGKLTAYARVTDDRNVFFEGMPLLSTGSGAGTKISPYPGFDQLTGTTYGNGTRFVTYDTGVGQSQTLDLGQGRGINSHIVGFDIDKQVGNFAFSDKMSYVSGDVMAALQSTGDLPETLSAFLAGEVTAGNANATALKATGGILATGGIATYAGTGRAVTDLNQIIISEGVGFIDQHFSSYENEARLSRPLSESNTLTIGAYLSSYSDAENRFAYSQQLMQLQNNPQVIDITLNNGEQVTNADGIYSPVTNATAFSFSARNIAGIIEDDWRLTDDLRIDAGYRLEHISSSGEAANLSKANIYTNPLQLYDYGAAVRTGGSTGYGDDAWAHALTAGVDYEIQKNFNAFLRYNQGYSFPNFNAIISADTTLTHVEQAQGGIKYGGSVLSTDLTGFYSNFTGTPSQQTLTNGTIINYLTSAETEGLEFQGTVRPVDHLQFDVMGDYMHGVYTAGGPGITGNIVQRQPTFQAHFRPRYTIPADFAVIQFYVTGTYVGQRWSDLQNTQSLPAYATLDIGAVADFDDGVSIQLTGTNVTNTLAITEGNPRVLGAGVGSSGVFIGRALFGADYQLSAVVRF